MKETYANLFAQWSQIPEDYRVVMVHNITQEAKSKNPLYSSLGAKGESSPTVVGWYSGRFSVGFGSRFFSLGNGIGDLISVSPQVLGYFQSLAEKYNVKIVPPQLENRLSSTFLSLFNTIKFWVGYEPISINLSLQYLIVDQQTLRYYQRAVGYLMSGVLPASSKEFIVQTPGGYLADAKSLRGEITTPPPGTWTVRIGRWFEYNGFLIKDVNFTFDSKVVKAPISDTQLSDNSLPMMVDIQVTLEPWRLLLAEEAFSMFKFFRF